LFSAHKRFEYIVFVDPIDLISNKAAHDADHAFFAYPLNFASTKAGAKNFL
jgi:hypothetical protein